MRSKEISFNEILIITLLLATLEAIIFFSVWKPAITVYPSSDFTYAIYSDNDEYGGASTIHTEFVDGKMDVFYYLTNDYEWPYAGLRLKPPKPLNLKVYEYLYINVSVKTEQNLIVALWTSLPEAVENPIEAQPHFYDINITPDQKIYKIPLDAFNTPSWWLAEYRVGLNEFPKDLMKEVVALGFQSGYIQKANQVHSFSVQDIKTNKDYMSLYIIMASILLISIMVLSLRIMWIKSTNRRVIIPLKDVTGKSDMSKPFNRIVSVIGQECDQPGLTLQKVAALSYASEDEVLQTVKGEFGMHFLQYLDLVRLELASNLLEVTNIPIDEVSAKSGYIVPEHFESSFKKYHHQTPEAYRASFKKKG